MFEEPCRGWADLVLPGHELPRARRHLRQPRGPPPAPAPRRDPARAGRARLDLEARRALRRRALAVRVGRLRRALRADATAASRSARSASRPRCRTRSEAPAAEPARAAGRAQGQGPAPAPLPAALLRPRGRARARARSSSGRAARSSSRPSDARAPRDRERRRRSRVSLERHLARAARAGQRATCAPGVVRIAAEHAGELATRRGGGGASDRALVDLAHQGVPDHQPRPAHVRLHDVARAQGARPDAAPLRPEPRRPVRAAAADRRPGQADPQGDLLPRDRGRRALHRRAGALGLHRARSRSP